jgi:predicted transcriptional regulator
MSDSSSRPTLLALTAQIVAAHVGHNSVPRETLPALIESIYTTLSKVGVQAEAPKLPEPAVPVKRSVFPDYIVCLEDGKRLKMLKRHLQTSYNMSPSQYRERWSLPADYPMVAPNYAAKRSSLAKSIGLGRKAAAPAPAAAPVAVPAKRGRKPKAG